jgi:quercetin dioxygenase-like cupin family protein
MKIYAFDEDSSKTLEQYDAVNVAIAQIAKGAGTYRISCVYFAPGGTIGDHLTGMPQVFMVVAGCGWVSGKDQIRVPIVAGQAAVWDSHEAHVSGTDDGMTVIMVQTAEPGVVMPPAVIPEAPR